MVKFRYIHLAALLPLSLIGVEEDPKHMRVSARHIEAGGIGYNKGYTTLEAFLAADPDLKWGMPFLDLRGHVFNDGRLAANVGVGARAIWGCRAYGINTYYDYRSTSRKTFNQIGLGLETLGELWDLRVNGYLPVGKKVSHPYDIGFGGFSGHSILVDRKFQYAMKGIDGEVGFHFGETSNWDFYGAAGPYYFKGEMGKGAIGGKARLAAFYKEYVTLEVSDSFDNVFHNNVQGQLTLTIPFGPRSRVQKTQNCCPDTCQFAKTLTRRMVQPVPRQEIVVVDSHKKTDTANSFVVFVNNLSHSLGTYESPYPTLELAETNSSAGDIIYVFYGDGTTTGMDAGITLKEGQKFWGSGASHNLATQYGMITVPKMSALNPNITNSGMLGSGIRLASGTEVSGITVTGTSSYGIVGTSVTDVNIIDSIVHGSSSSGILLNAAASLPQNITLARLLVEQNLAGGISLVATNAADVTIDISDCIIELNALFTGSGISYIAQDTSVINGSFERNKITSNGINGIDLNFQSDSINPFNINIVNNIFETNGTNGINGELSGNSVYQVNIRKNTMIASGNDAIFFGATSTDATINVTGNTISGAVEFGIDIFGNCPPAEANFITCNISENRITDTISGGVLFQQTDTGVQTIDFNISNNVIDHYLLQPGIQLQIFEGAGSLDFTIASNVINTGPTGISLGYSASAAGLTGNYSILNNRVFNNYNSGISIGGTGTNQSLVVIAQGNTIYNSGGSQASPDNAGFKADVSPGGGGDSSLCLTLENNRSDTGYLLTQSSAGSTGTFNLAPNGVAGAQEVNTGTISTSGTIGSVATCP